VSHPSDADFNEGWRSADTYATEHFEAVKAERDRLRALVADFTDPDPCQYDHHGLCQVHSLHERPCPHEVAKREMKGEDRP
jgi:hypothetical protein